MTTKNRTWTRVPWTAVLVLIASVWSLSAHAHGMTDADKASMVSGGYADFFRLGASHMLTGYDHLLFLFGVIFFLDRFKDIVKFITAFTLGHSITLIAATFLEISANYHLVDAVIALTVVYKGFENLNGFERFFKMKSPSLVLLVFGFGLIHGFGLSTRLQQVPTGDDGLLLKIISFNLGVEVGQIVALTAMLFLLAGWRKRESFARFSAASNFGLIIAGTFLLLFQLHGYSHEGSAEAAEFSAEAQETEQAIAVHSEGWQDVVVITVPAGRGLEYKFQMLEGSVIEYAWETDGAELDYDFHGEWDDGEDDGEQTYEETTGNASSGSMTVPFEGSHGWWWKNNGPRSVQVTLKTNGAYEILGLL